MLQSEFFLLKFLIRKKLLDEIHSLSWKIALEILNEEYNKHKIIVYCTICAILKIQKEPSANSTLL